jgi:hypothetical protein
VVQEKKLLVREREKSGDLVKQEKKRIISLKERGRAETLVVQEKKKNIKLAS